MPSDVIFHWFSAAPHAPPGEFFHVLLRCGFFADSLRILNDVSRLSEVFQTLPENGSAIGHRCPGHFKMPWDSFASLRFTAWHLRAVWYAGAVENGRHRLRRRWRRWRRWRRYSVQPFLHLHFSAFSCLLALTLWFILSVFLWWPLVETETQPETQIKIEKRGQVTLIKHWLLYWTFYFHNPNLKRIKESQGSKSNEFIGFNKQLNTQRP